MPKAVTCTLNGQTIGVDEALARKVKTGRCVECDKPVSAFRKSAVGDAHFEHRRRNPKCSLSDHRSQ